MDQAGLNTTQLHRWIDRLREGESAAPEELLRQVCGRLERLARRMLRSFPGVARWEDTMDVLQNASLRLLRALKNTKPDSVASFFNLAAQLIRRELIDLARHYQGPQGMGAHHRSRPMAPGKEDDHAGCVDLPDIGENEDDLERWAMFHQEVENLPTKEREVLGLAFYHGWTQAEIARLFRVDERTIRRYYQSACVKLHDRLGGRTPDLH